ncbi:MAG: hypothetical protein R2710_00260 [Acidimicrobiales bacterium]
MTVVTAATASHVPSNDLLDAAHGLDANTIELRRAIHADPELGLDLPATQAKILDALTGLGLDITLGESLTSVVADLDSGKPGPTVLLRGDMDALPLQEDYETDFQSRHQGRMRAVTMLTLRCLRAPLDCSARTPTSSPARFASCSSPARRVWRRQADDRRGRDQRRRSGLRHPRHLEHARRHDLHQGRIADGERRHLPHHDPRRRRARLGPHHAIDPIPAAAATCSVCTPWSAVPSTPPSRGFSPWVRSTQEPPTT